MMEVPAVKTPDVNEMTRRRIAMRENLRGWGIIGPIILYLIIFTFIPLIILFRYSFTQDDLFKGTFFVGLANYVTIFTDPDYYLRFLRSG